jgi:hypothetical protein
VGKLFQNSIFDISFVCFLPLLLAVLCVASLKEKKFAFSSFCQICENKFLPKKYYC